MVTSTTLYQNRIYRNEGSPDFLTGLSGKKVLDIGCGAGDNARILKSQGCKIWGVTLSAEEANLHSGVFEKLYHADIQNWLPEEPIGFYDTLLFSHVLEHVADPASVITRLLPYLKEGGNLYIALPNFSFWRIRLRILFGRFSYDDQGILDRTHLRFFTPRSAKELVEGSGCALIHSTVDGHLPLPFLRTLFPSVCKKIDTLCCTLFPAFFGYHIQIIAQKSATLSHR